MKGLTTTFCSFHRKLLETIDQSEFEGFEYVNPLLMSSEECVWKQKRDQKQMHWVISRNTEINVVLIKQKARFLPGNNICVIWALETQ